MKIQLEQACALLQGAQRVLLLSHQNPDGDTLGSAFALGLALRQLGKQVRLECSDPVPPKYLPILGELPFGAFEPDLIVAVDIADPQLFGKGIAAYRERVDLCIDHHSSNSDYAAHTLVDPGAAANCELIYRVINALGVPIDPQIADCLYLGISTDTGCFRYSNTTAHTHSAAAALIGCGARHALINRLMFETKSHAQIEIERLAMNTIEYHFGARCAVIHVTQEMLQHSGATESELDGLSAKPRQIEGVDVAVTLREKEGGGYKISVRSNAPVDASAICKALGGGGHARAAGCFIRDTLEAAKTRVLQAAAPQLQSSEQE